MTNDKPLPWLERVKLLLSVLDGVPAFDTDQLFVCFTEGEAESEAVAVQEEAVKDGETERERLVVHDREGVVVWDWEAVAVFVGIRVGRRVQLEDCEWDAVHVPLERVAEKLPGSDSPG
jgi:hypothetical protein